MNDTSPNGPPGTPEEGLRHLVVIGASAGGITALSTLVSVLPGDFPAPIVVAQHVDPRRPSALAEILSGKSTLPVRLVAEREPLTDGTIFVVPADRHIEVTDHEVRVLPDAGGRPKPSIDRLFDTAARAYGEGVIAVILTGLGSDGAAGAWEVKRQGGTVIIQDPETAAHPSMPLSLAPGLVDLVASLEDVGPLLYDLLTGAFAAQRPDDEGTLRTFLDQLREQTGVDFGTYKRATILRRLQRRMVATHSANLRQYRRYLRSHPEEYQRLTSTFLIKVTEFFRDPELFQHLRDRVLPELIAEARARGNVLRFWSAGCATGEEAYSLAILLCEVLGAELEQFNVRVFATDLDDQAVDFARRGVYPSSALASLAPDLVERYFTRVNGEYEIRKQVRALTVFGQHDLAQRAPFPRTDLVLCRNVLIYFAPELQRRALQLFAFSLREGGYLALGKAETTSPLAEYFALEDPRLKLYRRHGERVLFPPSRIRDAATLEPPPVARTPAPRKQANAWDATAYRPQPPGRRPAVDRAEMLLTRLPVGVVVVDRRYDIRSINNAARRLCSIHGTATGEDFIHLATCLPSPRLRALVDAAFRGETPSEVLEATGVSTAPGESQYLEVECHLQTEEGDGGLNETVLLLLSDVTAVVKREQEMADTVARQAAEIERLTRGLAQLQASNEELMRANQELNISNVELRSHNEELLVSNEEAQAATEEVETLNEEMQAANEELETLNEELQATVEELNTTNDDLEARSLELQELANNLEGQRRASESERARVAAVLLSMSDAVLVINPQGEVVLSNDACARMFGPTGAAFVAEDEHGQPLPSDTTPQQRTARGERFTMEFTAVGEDGVRRWYEAIGQPIQADTVAQGGVVVIRDITDRSLRHLQEQFMSVATHELRTPITSLMGYLEMLKRRASATDQLNVEAINRYATTAQDEARRLGRLVDELMDEARLRSGKLTLRREPVDVAPLVEATVELAQAQTRGQTIHLTRVGNVDPLRVQGDAGRLRQVILNLLTNAIRYAPGTERIDVRLEREGEWAVVHVQDYGPGIAPEDRERIFSRFGQLSQTGAGTSGGLGLGLYIAHEIVSAHGGRISVDSAPGDGAIFTVRLPVTDAEQ